MKQLLYYIIPALLIAAGCSDRPGKTKSYAIYAEYAKGSNKLMHDGINRRVFDSVEAQNGSDIQLQKDGSIRLEAGTYRITGFSLVTTQITMAPPPVDTSSNYPGYCLVYPTAYDVDSLVLKHAFGIGSPSAAALTVPSTFDLVYNVQEATDICVGHQSGQGLKGVYVSVYEVDGIPSNYHVFARIAINKL